MEPLASSAGMPLEIAIETVTAAFDAAVAAASEAGDAAEAIDAALSELHAGPLAAGASAFVLEHGRLWSVGVRGYATIPDGLPVEEGVIGRAVRTTEVQLVRDVELDADYIDVSHGAASELAVPLLTGSDVVGVINIETPARLPVQSAAAVGPLALALAGAVESLRGSRTVDLSTLARLFVYMSSLRDPRAIAEVAVRSLGRVLPVETSQLLLLDDDGRLVETTEWSASGSEAGLLPGHVLQELRERVETSAVFELLDAPTTVPDLAALRFRSVVLIPLRANGAELGVLAGASRFSREFDRGQAELAALLGAHAAASLDAAIALDRERQSAHTDPLTGLLNRRGLEQVLDRELGDSREERSPLSLVVLDCDDFKDVNDRAGHEFGDALLREVGIVLREVCPEGSSPARLGGDEFVVMLPGLEPDAAVEAVEGLRRRLSAGLDQAGFPLRLSAGVSTYPYDGAGTTQLLRAADQALYSAKGRGRNRVVSFREVIGVAARNEPAYARGDRSRPTAEPSSSTDLMDAVTAIWSEQAIPDVLERLGKSISFVIGATGTAISRVEGSRLVDLVTHTRRDVQLDDDNIYLIADYPVTQEVLETPCIRSVSFLDEDLDAGEAFVLRELGMSAAMLVPLRVDDRSWGLVEIYDMRMRRYTAEDEAVAGFLVAQAGRRIEALRRRPSERRRLRLLRPPS